ncbi:hypothetical protein ACFWAY_15875 [Rhodococcus sp. NPDC059968]|uniref:hypothetical protein n=1 Tax=Rhodococcus sp. NPDC059968 TaxID=3347017 RepID=UPI003670227F
MASSPSEPWTTGKRNRRRQASFTTVFVRNCALVKLAAARANYEVGVLDEARKDTIGAACEEIAAGTHALQFPSALARKDALPVRCRADGEPTERGNPRTTTNIPTLRSTSRRTSARSNAAPPIEESIWVYLMRELGRYRSGQPDEPGRDWMAAAAQDTVPQRLDRIAELLGANWH